MDLSKNSCESFFGVVELGVDPDHAYQVENLGKHWRNVLRMGIGQLETWVFENGQELEVALCLVRPILHSIQTQSTAICDP